MGIRCVIFDYDGVIVDSFHDMHAVYQVLCKELGYDCPTDPEVFRSMYGRDYKTLYVSLGIPEELWEQGSRIYRREITKRDPKPFPLIKQQLAALAKQYSLYVVSATFIEEVKSKLARHDLAGYFQGIYGRHGLPDDIGKADTIRQILADEKVTPDQVIHIGDRNIDYEKSVQVGIPHTIILDYGWGNTLPDSQVIKVKRQEKLIDAIAKCTQEEAK